ncbi:MAG: flagellar hook-associated protein FlgK [Symbiobacteriia bacterium]
MGNSPFFGIDVGLSALQAQQRALEVTAHNIANVNTPGYSRQRLDLTASDPYTVPSAMRPGGVPGQAGTGVSQQAIERFHDNFLDGQYRNENASLGYWNHRGEVLHQIEGIFTEPSNAGIRSVLDKFWDSLQGLANDPSSYAARALTRQAGVAVADAFNHTTRQLTDLRSNLQQAAETKVGEVNVMASEIASLNKQISQAQSVGDNPNDLKDKRDHLLDELSKEVGGHTQAAGDGSVSVFLGGVPLVEGFTSHTLSIGNSVTDPVMWDHINQPASVGSGELSSILTLRDRGVPEYMTQLDHLAYTMATAFNTVHAAGWDAQSPPQTGTAFFVGVATEAGSAAAIQVNPAITGDAVNGVQLIAAGGTPLPDDGSNTMALADSLKSGPTGDLYRAIISGLGVDGQEADRMGSNQQTLLHAIDNQRDGVSGVSLDEEMSQMIKFQQGYAAAARVITAVDEMLDTIINRLGTVGR